MSYRDEVMLLPCFGPAEWYLVSQHAAAEIAARADARVAELRNALLAMIDAPPDFASHVSAIEKARAVLAKENSNG